ncbi:hypothetical protein LCGC14_2041350 [marine sediment metagenome]|uniref:Uncharacterized protein n=1 Tax=marine sediment metagenome TaxID=412755 RepID=A0A0F9H5A6_9ZZZZ
MTFIIVEFSSVSVAYEKAEMPTRSKANSIQSDRSGNTPPNLVKRTSFWRIIAWVTLIARSGNSLPGGR